LPDYHSISYTELQGVFYVEFRKFYVGRTGMSAPADCYAFPLICGDARRGRVSRPEAHDPAAIAAAPALLCCLCAMPRVKCDGILLSQRGQVLFSMPRRDSSNGIPLSRHMP